MHADRVDNLVQALLDDMKRRGSIHLDEKICEKIMLQEDETEDMLVAALAKLNWIKDEVMRRRIN